jgi:hypothetical protein
MRLHSGAARKFEHAIAMLILLILIAIAVGVYVRQRDVNMARFGVAPAQEAEQLKTPKADEAPHPPGLFAELAIGDLSPVGNTETYNADNLYEKIDGKAPMYIESGFNLLTTQRFASKDNPELGLELYLYDMGNSRNAFSVYSRQKRAEAEDLRYMPFGYKTSNAIYISHGRYYIEMIGFAESQELIDAMREVARKFLGQLGTREDDKIAEMGYFPAEGTIVGSWKLQLTDAFGFDGLTDTYSAKYKVGERTVTIFFSKCSNASEAQKVARSYSDFLVANGAKVGTVLNDALKAANASVLDFYGSTEIVFSTGVFVGGVHEADDRQTAEKAAEVLLERLNKISGEIDG